MFKKVYVSYLKNTLQSKRYIKEIDYGQLHEDSL